MSNSSRLERNIESGLVKIERFDGSDIGNQPVAWLQSRAGEGMTLLAHADDGVIWGRFRDGQLELPLPDVHEQAALRNETLQMGRLFDSEQETFIWRVDENSWRARTVMDGTGDALEYFDEYQVLWGTSVEKVDAGFARFAEGEQGLRHAPPLGGFEPGQTWQNGDHPLRLAVRHYLVQDDEGWTGIAFSRLTGLATQEVDG